MHTMTTNEMHPFEKSGLGKAPFRWLGVSVEVGPKRFIGKDGLEWSVGAPGQPMGVCAYCGQGISECHKIGSADGKTFIVGCDCVARVSSKGEPVLTQVEQASRNLRNVKARKRAAAKADGVDTEIDALMSDPAVTAKLASLPHPRGYTNRETGESLTLLDSVTWMLEKAGKAGRAKTLAAIKAAV